MAGAQAGVWPSGMVRDQGGGLTAYRLEAEAEAEAEADTVVDTFALVDPAKMCIRDRFSTAYSELTTSLDDAAEAVNDMAQALDRMADRIRDTDAELAGG